MMKETRALVLTPDFPPMPGGIQLLMHRLVSNFSSVRSRVVSLGVEGAARFDGESDLDVIRVAQKGGPLNRVAVAQLNVSGFREGRKFGPDVVVSGHAVTAPAAAALRARRNIPMIQYLHSDEFRHRPRLVRFAVGQADAVVAVSRHAADLARAAHCDDDRLHLVHPGVDLPTESPNGRADRPTILTVARMHDHYKGHDLMIRAMPLIRLRVPGVQWIVIGDGPLRPALEEAAAMQGLGESVQFLGRALDRERDGWLRRSHVFALPSRLPAEGTGGEGFGIVYLEAGAHELPVVGVSEGGALDAIVDGETGVLVDPLDHIQLADAIAGLLLEPTRAAALGAAGARRARQFTWRRHARSVEDLLDEVNGKPR